MQYPQLASTLHNAAMKGDRTETLAGLKNIHQLEERSRSITPLQSAANSGHYTLLPLLLTGGARVNAAPSEFGRAIQTTISSLWFDGIPDKIGLKLDEHIRKKKAAQQEAVSFLLDHGADPNAPGGEFGSPIAAAAAFGSPEIMKLLLASGASPDSPDVRFGCALQAACAQGGMPVEWCVSPAHPEDYAEVQEVLLRNGSQVNYVGGIYGNAMEAAAFLGDTSTVSRLLVEGADPDIRAGKYGSALGAAADQGHTRVVKELLDVVSRTSVGDAVHSSDDWYKWKSKSISSMLLVYGAPLPSTTISMDNQNVPDIENPATLAYRNGHFDIVRMLPNNDV